MSATDAAIALYRQHLDPDWRAVHEAVARALAAREVSFLGRPVVRALRPVFLDPGVWHDACRGALHIARAVEALARRAAVDDGLRSTLGLGEREARLIHAEPDPAPLVARLDGFLGDDGTLRFLEYNPIPFGTVFSEWAGAAFAQTGPLQAVRARHGARPMATTRRLTAALLTAHATRSRGGRAAPNIAVVLGDAGARQIGQTEGQAMIQLATQAGASVRVVAPEAVERRGAGLWAEDFPIDCLTFGDNEEFLARFPPDHAVWAALRAREVWLFGALAAAALHGNKALFARLGEPAIAASFPADTRDAIRRHLPWSRIVRDTTTDHHGATIDLLPFIRRERERLVLKPATGFGGAGVVLGWSCTAQAWDAALDDCARRTCVVQERVAARLESFPCVEDGALVWSARRVDLNPYVWNGAAVDGALARVSDHELLNITTGHGSLAPVFILDRSADHDP